MDSYDIEYKYMLIFHILGIKILILTRRNQDYGQIQTGVLTLRSDSTQNFKATYEPVSNNFVDRHNLIATNVGNASFIGGMLDMDREIVDSLESRTNDRACNVFEYDLKDSKRISNLNFEGPFSSLLYFSPSSKSQEKVLIATGYSSYYDLIFGTKGSNRIEYLILNDWYRTNSWKVCKDKLPSNVSDYQINIHKDQIILTGGYHCDDREYSNQAWQGNVVFDGTELRVSWTLLKPMHEKRLNHVAIVIDDFLYCLGGEEDEDKDDLKSTEYYSFVTKEWARGKDLSFGLSQAKGVVVEALKLCFIIGGVRNGVKSSKVSLFDPVEESIDIEKEINLDIYNEIAAVLL